VKAFRYNEISIKQEHISMLGKLIQFANCDCCNQNNHSNVINLKDLRSPSDLSDFGNVVVFASVPILIGQVFAY